MGAGGAQALLSSAFRLSLFACGKFPVLQNIFPVRTSREFHSKPAESLREPCNAGREQRQNWQNSLLISLLAGNSTCETGSTATASATTQSCTNGDFPVQCESPRISGDLCTHFISAICRLDCRDRFEVQRVLRTGRRRFLTYNSLKR